MIFTSPIAGKATLSKVWTEKQTINAGEEVVTIVPNAGSSKVFCQATMPVANSGKVKIGQGSTIRFDNFPYQQYGVLEGTVQNIVLVPQKGKETETYQVHIRVNDSLLTTYHKPHFIKKTAKSKNSIKAIKITKNCSHYSFFT